MSNQIDFYDKPLYKITEYAIVFILSNIYFLICNIALLFYLIAIAIEPDAFSVFMLFIFLIPTGPAIATLCACMGKLVKDKEIKITSYFFKYYKENFFTSLKIWVIELVALFIFTLDYIFFTDRGNIIGICFLALTIYALIIILYSFPLMSKFNFPIKNLLLTCLYYSIKKFPITLSKIGLLVLTYFIYIKSPIIVILCLFSLGSYIIMLLDKNIIIELEYKLNSDNKILTI